MVMGKCSDFHLDFFFVPSASTKHLKNQLHHMCYHVSPGLHVAMFSGAGGGGRVGARQGRGEEEDSCAVRRNR